MRLFKKFSDYWDSRLNEESVKRISAALGSFLMLVLASLSTPLHTILNDLFGAVWATFLIIIWGGLVTYLGTFIVSVFGTTHQLQLNQDVDEEVAEAIEDAEETAEEIEEELEEEES